jgi:hypothetical protein
MAKYSPPILPDNFPEDGCVHCLGRGTYVITGAGGTYACLFCDGTGKREKKPLEELAD